MFIRYYELSVQTGIDGEWISIGKYRTLERAVNVALCITGDKPHRGDWDRYDADWGNGLLYGGHCSNKYCLIQRQYLHLE